MGYRGLLGVLGSNRGYWLVLGVLRGTGGYSGGYCRYFGFISGTTKH